jgi:hypothetical protein
MPKKKILRKKGKKPISFTPGGLHASLGMAPGIPIPGAKFQAALSGKFGPKAAKQARFKKNVLTGPKKKKMKKP